MLCGSHRPLSYILLLFYSKRMYGPNGCVEAMEIIISLSSSHIIIILYNIIGVVPALQSTFNGLSRLVPNYIYAGVSIIHRKKGKNIKLSIINLSHFIGTTPVRGVRYPHRSLVISSQTPFHAPLKCIYIYTCDSTRYYYSVMPP